MAGGALNGLGAWTSFRALESGGKASIVISLISLYPLLTVVLAVLLLGERLTWMQMAGAVVGHRGRHPIVIGRGAQGAKLEPRSDRYSSSSRPRAEIQPVVIDSADRRETFLHREQHGGLKTLSRSQERARPPSIMVCIWKGIAGGRLQHRDVQIAPAAMGGKQPAT